MALGQAYIDVHANTRPFLDDVARLRALLAGMPPIPIPIGGGSGGNPNDPAPGIRRVTNDVDGLGRSSRGTRLLVMGLGVAFLAVEASAVAMGVAIAAAGIKSEESIRTLRLSITDTGQTIQQANKQVAALQNLAAKGLSFTGLIADNRTLEDLNLTAANSVKVLTALGNIGAGEGLVGADLDTFVANAAKAISNIAQAKNVTASSLKEITGALGISQTQLQKQLGLTAKQFDNLIAKGKLSTSTAVNGALAAANAQPNTKNGLGNATNTSVTQAFDAIKQQLGTAIGIAFDNPQIAESITSVAGKLKDAVSGIAPEIQKDALAVVDFLGSAIGPVSDFLAKTLRGLGDFFKQAATEGTPLNAFFDTLRSELQDIGVIAVPAFKTLATAIGIVVTVMKPLLDFLAFIAQSPAGPVLFDIAAGLTAVGVASRIAQGSIGGTKGLLGSLFLVGGAFDIGDKIGGWVANLGLGESAAGKLKDTINQLKQSSPGLVLSFENAGLSAQDAAFALGGFNDALNAHTSLAAGVIGNLQKEGLTSLQVVAALEAMGVSADAANAAVGGISTASADAQLSALSSSALVAAGSLAVAAAEAQAAWSAANGGLFGPIDTKVPGTLGKVPTTPSVPKVSLPKIPTFGSGGGAGTSAAASAAKALKAALVTFHQSLSDFVQGIGGAQTVAAVDSAFQTLQSAIDTEDKALGKSEPAGLKTYLAKQKAILDKSASELQLALAERADFLSKADVSVPNARQAGAGGLIKGLQDQLTLSTEFAADLKKLQGLGLNQTAINQFLAAGPTEPSLRAMNDIIQAGKPAVSSINTLQTAIGKQGESLGTSLASNFKDAGTQAAQGLIDGLASAEPALEAQMKKLANVMTTTIKKDLKIKSPSQVFAEVGQNITAGLIQGIGDKAPVVPLPTIGKLGAQGVATDQSINFHANAINVSGATKDNATEIGNGIGAAIADVLLARRIGAALGSS